MRVTNTSSNQEILAELGGRLRRYRLQQNRTTQSLADATGLTSVTIERAERGSNPTFDTIIRILRALNRLDALETLLPAPLPSPLELARLSGRQRKRAGTRRRSRKEESRGE